MQQAFELGAVELQQPFDLEARASAEFEIFESDSLAIGTKARLETQIFQGQSTFEPADPPAFL